MKFEDILQLGVTQTRFADIRLLVVIPSKLGDILQSGGYPLLSWRYSAAEVYPVLVYRYSTTVNTLCKFGEILLSQVTHSVPIWKYSGTGGCPVSV